MSSDPVIVAVIHRPELERFEATVDGQLCLVEYLVERERVTIHHTYVPASLRGRGIAEELTVAALDWVSHSGRTLVPACSYTAGYLRRHPDAFPAARIHPGAH